MIILHNKKKKKKKKKRKGIDITNKVVEF